MNKIVSLFLFFVLLLFFVYKFDDYYYNDIKPRIEGYKYISESKIFYNKKPIEEFIFKYILWEDTKMMPVNEDYKICIEENRVYDLGCFMSLKTKNIPYAKKRDFYDCEWTYGNSFVAVNYKDYYLMDISERPCGSMKIYFHDYYLIKYDGKKLNIVENINFGKHPEGPIKMYKIEDNFIKITSKSCTNKGLQDCSNLRDRRYFMSLNNSI